ncbi:MAG: phospholipid carrier-dependent glycosyltransferase [Deltaproteobacteria bacterium]|nr:phospholipid carrier-dependent glycosyltransferase [Deltaproteobacteria bacterium]
MARAHAPAAGERRAARAECRASDRPAIFALLALASALFLTGLGTIDLWAPDEPRYGAIAEALRSGRHGPGGLVLLHLNDQPYDQKPPLYFWLAAAFGLPFGRVDEVAARLPSALAAVASVGLTFAIARLLGRPTVGALLAAGLLATSFRFAFTARRAQLDVLLTAFELAAIALFLVLYRRQGGIEQARRRPGLIAALHLALGAAALVKGPVAWLPLLVFAAWLAWEGRLSAFWKIAPAWAWLLSLGPVCLWITAATALAPEGFARDAIGTNVFARFFAGTSHARPFYYYAYQLPLDGLPWSLLWPIALPALVRAARDRRPAAASTASPIDAKAARFLAAWCLVPLVFFTLSAGKRGLYLLPIHPALALVSSLVVSIGSRDGAPARRGPLRARPLAIAIALVAVVELALALLVLPRLDGEKSPRPIAAAIARHSAPAAQVGLYRLRPLEGAIPYYGRRAVASLASEDAAQAFLAGGDRLILLRASDYEALGERLALEPVERFRSGRRALVLAHPRKAPPGLPPHAVAPGRSPPASRPPPPDRSDEAH